MCGSRGTHGGEEIWIQGFGLETCRKKTDWQN